MPHDSKAVANFFLDIARAEGKDLSPMKLQKLVYFAHGWFLGLSDEPLIDEQVEAWPYGPVIPSLYHEFKRFGNEPITEPASELDFDDSLPGGCAFRTPSIEDNPAGNLKYTREFLKRVWDIYGVYTATQLSNLTHEPGTPWDQLLRRYNGHLPKSTDIPQETIRDYFKSQAKPAP